MSFVCITLCIVEFRSADSKATGYSLVNCTLRWRGYISTSSGVLFHWWYDQFNRITWPSCPWNFDDSREISGIPILWLVVLDPALGSTAASPGAFNAYYAVLIAVSVFPVVKFNIQLLSYFIMSWRLGYFVALADLQSNIFSTLMLSIFSILRLNHRMRTHWLPNTILNGTTNLKGGTQFSEND